MGVIRFKIWYDLWRNKGRTLRVVLIIAMGAFAIGMIVGARSLFIPSLQAGWKATNPAMITLGTSRSVDDDTIRALSRLEELEGTEGYTTLIVEWRLSPEDDWSAANLTARDDYENQKYQLLSLTSGAWPRDRTVAVAQDNDVVFGIEVGGQVFIRVDDREHLLEIGGVVYDPVIQPPNFGGTAQFYTTRDRLGELTGDRNYNRILARGWRYDETGLLKTASEMQRKLENQGVDSFGAAATSGPPGARVSDPNKHFFQDIMDGMFLVLGIMAILALILGLFLVYNTINAIITEQVDQIGVMKAVGAKTGSILGLYLITVSVYGFLALLIAVPLGAIGAYGLDYFMLASFSLPVDPFAVSPPAVVAQVAIALLAPLLASVIPIFRGARLTVREAISTYGLSAGFSRLDKLLAQVERLSRQLLMTVSNTFRHKGRVALTQATLVLSGLIFMMVLSVRDSSDYTFGDILFSILRYNITLMFEEYERVDRVEELTMAQQGVKAVEMWIMDLPKIRPQGQPESDDDLSVGLFGVPLPTTLYGPQMRAGRWLESGDSHAVVLNQQLAEEAGVGVGDWVTFDHGVRGETSWQVVGLLFDPLMTDSAHVPRDLLLRQLGSAGKANTVWVQTVRDDPESEVAVADVLRAVYAKQQLDLNPGGTFGIAADTKSELLALFRNNFGFLITLLAIMAVVIGMVGSIALSGVLSLNVLERRREIGVMRAIGASSWAVTSLFIGEGLILGWLSWLLALPLSLPAGRLMADGLGAAIGFEIIYNYTPTGALAWFSIITVLSIIASWFPARGAARVSVRESLAYQ